MFGTRLSSTTLGWKFEVTIFERGVRLGVVEIDGMRAAEVQYCGLEIPSQIPSASVMTFIDGSGDLIRVLLIS